ncbi:MAG: Copper binding protein plastocyanin/azurin family [Actinomycetota bacterium]|jgi:plastocyanin|nr:Copper binding protein plastocyanin/azurin family [Actinomycetota bacterium]
MNLRRLAVVALAVGTLFAFPGTSLGDSFRVKAVGSSPADFRWNPDFRHITKGDRIVWKNTTNTTHRVVAWKGAWSKETDVPPGETTSKRFRKTGAFFFRCTIPGHSSVTNGECSGMCGEIHVVR